MTHDSNNTAALDLLYREHNFYLDALSAVRNSSAQLLGLGVTVNLALAALAFRDGRRPDPQWLSVMGFGGLAIFLVFGFVILYRSRSAATWPPVDTILADHQGSPIDLRENFLSTFKKDVVTFRSKLRRYDLGYALLIVFFILVTSSWIYAVATQSAPVANGGTTSTTTTTP
jgi:hypothetical protein